MIIKIAMVLIGLLWTIGVVIVLVELKGTKPLGYEDETGFHYGKEPADRL